MRCPRCQHDNPSGTKFCGECAAPLASVCAACGAANPAENRFCGQCAAPLLAAPDKFPSPRSYTPQHLAEKILTSKSALEGERKQVTVLFADLKGSMELLADRDPEEARKLLDPVLERMIEAVHRYAGTVNQVMGDGIMALFGAPLAHEDHAVRACYAALRMQESVAQYAEGLFRSHDHSVQNTGFLGYTYALSGRLAEGIPLLEHALSASEAMRHGVAQPLFLMYLGEAYVLADRLEDALELAGRALTLARERGQRGYEAWALRLLGEVAARRDPPEHADGHYRDALALAQELGMRPLRRPLPPRPWPTLSAHRQA